MLPGYFSLFSGDFSFPLWSLVIFYPILNLPYLRYSPNVSDYCLSIHIIDPGTKQPTGGSVHIVQGGRIEFRLPQVVVS